MTEEQREAGSMEREAGMGQEYSSSRASLPAPRSFPLVTLAGSPERLATEVAIVCETEMHCAPWWHDGEKSPRLDRARRWVLAGNVQPLAGPAGYWQVQSSNKERGSYTLKGDHCECTAATSGKSRYCYHAVSVELYMRVARRLGAPPVQKVEVPMIPEVVAEDTAPTTLPVPAQATLPVQATPATMAEAMSRWVEERRLVLEFIRKNFVEGIDYYRIPIKDKETGRIIAYSKPSMSKAGSEKIHGWLDIRPTFRRDPETWEMLGSPAGTLTYICELVKLGTGEIVGEGRGARRVQDDKGDVNKCIKMAQKSAATDATLRAFGLSEVFTQDLEPPRQASSAPRTPQVATSASPQDHDEAESRTAIINLVRTLRGPGDAAHCHRVVEEVTGLLLTPAHYPQIIERLTKAVWERQETVEEVSA